MNVFLIFIYFYFEAKLLKVSIHFLKLLLYNYKNFLYSIND